MRYKNTESFVPQRNSGGLYWIYGLFGILVILLLIFLVNEKNWRPVKSKPQWSARSNYGQMLVSTLIDRNIETAWSSLAPVTSGMFVEIDLGASTVINGVVLQGEKKGIVQQPKGLIVKVSLDGQEWQTVAMQREISYKSFFVLAFAPVKTRYLQVIEPSVLSALEPWIIYELDLLQPLVPWQVKRTTLLNAIIGILVAIGGLLMMWAGDAPPVVEPRHRVPWQHVWMKPALFLAILLVGWGLRMAILDRSEFSVQDLTHLSVFDPEATDDIAWLTLYFHHTETGVAWLSLLLMRWWYRLFADYLVALRMTAALSGAAVIGLVPFLWKRLLGNKHTWEHALFAAALMSVSGLPVALLHRDDFSGAVVFFMLLYILLTFRLLYQQGSYLWAVVLGLVLVGAFFIAPAMHYLPMGILIFGSLHGLIRWRRGQRDNLRELMTRYGIYIISCAPLYGYLLVMRFLYTWPSPFMSFSLNGSAVRALLQAFQLCGFTGFSGWILWGVVLVGVGRVLWQRSLNEWFFYSQGLIAFLLAPEKEMMHGLLAVMGLLLLSRGLQSILALFSTWTSNPAARMVQIAAYGLILVYLGGFAVNSLLIGNLDFPHAPSAVQQLVRTRILNQAIEQMRDDQNDCKEIAVLGGAVAEIYTSHYRVNPYYSIKRGELQHRITQRLFPTYLWVIDPDHALVEAHKLTESLQRYYHETCSYQHVSIYTLRQEFLGLPKRYLVRDLYRGIGKMTDDKESSSGSVRYAAPENHQPGLLVFGPYTPVCANGSYLARFALRMTDFPDDATAPVARLEVVADTYTILTQVELTGRDFPDTSHYYTFDLPFPLDVITNPALQMTRLQFWVHFTGQTQIRLDYVDLIPQF